MNRLKKTGVTACTVYVMLACGTAFAQNSSCGTSNPGRYDRDHNGYLSQSEAYGTPIAPMFERADTNRDHYLSPREFADSCRSDRYGNSSSDSPPDSHNYTDAVNDEIRRQGQRQTGHVTDRINQEIDDATDGSVNRALDSLFGH